MKRLLIVFMVVLTGSANASVIELVDNGGFETGNFNSWTVTNLANGGCGQNIWEVLSDGVHECADNNGVTAVAPVDGQFAAYSTFDGPAGTLNLSQSVLLPALFDSLSFSWLQTVDMNGGGTRTVSVDLFDNSNSLIANVSSQVFSNGNFQNWTAFNFDLTSTLSTFAGQSVSLSFSNIIPNSFTGPGGFGLDSVSLVAEISEVQDPTPAPAPASLALLGLGLAAVSLSRRKRTR